MRFLPVLALSTALLLPAAAYGRGAHLTIASRSPLTITGVGFAAGERVRVVVAHDGSTTRWAVTNRIGTFTVRLPIRMSSCDTFAIRALGSRGDGATLLVRSFECPPPATP